MRTAGVIAAALISALAAAAAQPGKNALVVRGQEQAIYYYPSTTAKQGAVLFAPGDGGWRGVAETFAATIATWGYDVYGFDTKRYLESFTPAGKPTLTAPIMAADLAQVAAWVSGKGRERILFVGWSEGAALAALAGSSPEGKSAFAGIALVGLPESGVLGWKMADTLATFAKREPDEPHYRTSALLPGISPLPLWMIYGSDDEYTSPDRAKSLFASAREAKKIVFVPGANHRFDGKREQYYDSLKEGLSWLRSLSSSPSRPPD